MKRKECKEFSAIFDANKDQFGNGKTLIEFLGDVSSTLRSLSPSSLLQLISKESYLAACVNLISHDTSNFPLGVDRELGEDEAMISAQGEAALTLLAREYSSADVRQEGMAYAAKLGEVIENQKRKPPRLGSKKEIAEYLTQIHDEIHELKLQKATLEAEIEHKKDLYFTMRRHNIEIEEFRQLYDVYSEMLNKHIALKDRNAALANKGNRK